LFPAIHPEAALEPATGSRPDLESIVLGPEPAPVAHDEVAAGGDAPHVAVVVGQLDTPPVTDLEALRAVRVDDPALPARLDRRRCLARRPGRHDRRLGGGERALQGQTGPAALHPRRFDGLGCACGAGHHGAGRSRRAGLAARALRSDGRERRRCSSRSHRCGDRDLGGRLPGTAAFEGVHARGGEDRQGDRSGSDQPGRRPIVVRRGRAEHAPDPRKQRSVGRRNGEGPPVAASALEFGERAHVLHGIAAQAHRQVVAAVLPLDPHASREPPYRRMVEEQSLDHRLEYVDEVVVPSHVRELVCQDGLELCGRQPGERADRNQQHRFEPADHRRDVHGRRLKCDHPGRQVEPPAESSHRQGHLGGHRLVFTPPQALDRRPSANQPDRQPRDPDEPEDDQPGQPALHLSCRRHRQRGPIAHHLARSTRWRRPDRQFGRTGRRETPEPRRSVRRGLAGGPEGHGGQRQHQRQPHGRDQIADVGRAPPQHDEGRARHRGHQPDLPDRVHERPAKRLRERTTEQHLNRAHAAPPCVLRSGGESRRVRLDSPAWRRAPA
jgi:hypothetical protein